MAIGGGSIEGTFWNALPDVLQLPAQAIAVPVAFFVVGLALCLAVGKTHIYYDCLVAGLMATYTFNLSLFLMRNSALAWHNSVGDGAVGFWSIVVLFAGQFFCAPFPRSVRQKPIRQLLARALIGLVLGIVFHNVVLMKSSFYPRIVASWLPLGAVSVIVFFTLHAVSPVWVRRWSVLLTLAFLPLTLALLPGFDSVSRWMQPLYDWIDYRTSVPAGSQLTIWILLSGTLTFAFSLAPSQGNGTGPNHSVDSNPPPLALRRVGHADRWA